MKRIAVLLFAGLISAAAVTGCSSESTSTTTFTTSVTDENGETTTTTRTTENGETTESTITTSENDPTGLRKRWHELFYYGAEGKSADGEQIYLAYDDPEKFSYAAMMILSEDGSTLINYDLGELSENDGFYEINDVDGEEIMPFAITDNESDDYVTVEFKDGDTADLYYVDQETIIDDMITIWENTDHEEEESGDI